MSLAERAARTMAAGYRVFRVDSNILPNPGGPAGGRRGPAQGATFDSRSHIRLIAEAAAQMRDGIGPDGNWMIDLHQKFDFTKRSKYAASWNRTDRSSSRILCGAEAAFERRVAQDQRRR